MDFDKLNKANEKSLKKKHSKLKSEFEEIAKKIIFLQTTLKETKHLLVKKTSQLDISNEKVEELESRNKWLKEQVKIHKAMKDANGFLHQEAMKAGDRMLGCIEILRIKIVDALDLDHLSEARKTSISTKIMKATDSLINLATEDFKRIKESEDY